MSHGTGIGPLPNDMAAEARIVAVHCDGIEATLDLECDGCRYTVRAPTCDRPDARSLRAYQKAMLVPGDAVLTEPHPRDVAPGGQLTALMVPRGVITVPALRLLLDVGTTATDFTRMIEYVSYVRAALGRFCEHTHVRQQISDRHSPDGRCNRIVPEVPIGGGSYIIGDRLYLSLRTNPLPETVLNALEGRPIDDVVGHPLTDDAGITIIRMTREDTDAVFDLDVPSMTFAQGLAAIEHEEGKRR